MTIDTTYLDADTDSVKAARAAILAMAEAINAMDPTAPTFTGLAKLLGGEVVAATFTNPASGSTVVMTAADRVHVNVATGTKASVLYNLPASPVNGQVHRICTDGAITSVSVRDGAGVSGNVRNAPTTFAAGGSADFVYRSGTTTWYCTGKSA